MFPGFGKQTLSIGSDPRCDIVLQGPGVAAEHARLTHQGGGKVMFVNLGTGPSSAQGRTLGAGEQVPFDFRTPFQVAGQNLPFDHPAITLSLMAQGQQAAQAGRVVIGRDPTQVTLVIQHPSVSSRHLSLALDRMMLIDNDSTSGTYIAGQRIAPNTPTPIPQQGYIHLGPVPVQTGLLLQVAQALAGMQPAVGGGGDPARASAMPSAQQPSAPQPSAQQPVAQAVHTSAVPSQGAPTSALQVGQMAQVLASAGAQHAPQPQQPQGSGPSGSPQVRKHKTVFGQLDFTGAGGGGMKTIGRTPDNDIPIAHPQVSSHHAQVELVAGNLFVMDRGSANGTYVRGQRIPPGQKIQIQSGEKVYIGPMPLQLMVGASGAVEVFNEAYAEAKWAGRPLYEIEAWSLFLQVPDRDDKTKDKVLLDNISFKALPGDMIALMGPSGAGKTTLLLALNGYLPPTEGLVRINGEDLYSIYDTLRGSIGYVPQDDLVHPELTVWEAVRYSAKFRLPPDFTETEIEQRVDQTLRDLGLESVAHLQIGSPEAKVLSGGQRKRVNIALELVTDPVILYLDEPTSGLASDDAASLITLLHELVRATGKTIIMTIHQPAVDEYEKFSHSLILGYGGVPMYFGPTVPDSYSFFSSFAAQLQGRPSGVEKLPVDNPRDMFALITARERQVYDQLLSQNPGTPRSAARHQAAMQWRAEFFAETNPIYKKMYAGRRAVGTGEGHKGVPEGRPSTRGQFRLLVSRYFRTKIRDRVGTGILFAQAPIIGVLLALVFGFQTDAVPAWCLGALQELSQRTGEKAASDIFGKLAVTQDHTGAAFFMVVSAIWFGTSNAAREIVKERSIYLRERMVNLGLLNYVMSKFVLLSLFCIVQCAMLLGIVFFALGFHGGMNAFLQELGALVATAVAAIALGLLLSTLVTTSEAAMALTPIALIPQVVLGGLMVPATTIPKLNMIMYAIPARWGFEASIVPERLALKDETAWLVELGSDKTSAADYIFGGKFQCSVAQMSSDTLNGAWSFTTYETTWIPYAVLGAMTFTLLIAILVLLKQRDPV
jgi:ABC-type multidrug transport system ATPase subunit/pSer/pThr/pTyr-binding forkhead associated (FHA) protein